MNNLLTGFADELVKVGTITNVLKQYRSARDLITKRKSSWHGTPKADAILAKGEIVQSTSGRHGPGVYLWRESPRPPYFSAARPEGFAVSTERIERATKKPLIDAATRAPAPAEMQRQVALYRGSGSEALKLAPKDVAVVQPGAALEEGRRAHKVRHIHPEILRRALADIRAEGLARAGKADFDPEDVVGPSVRELRKLMAGKAKTPKLRASADDFVEDYAEKIL